jgi:hypothetical protein
MILSEKSATFRDHALSFIPDGSASKMIRFRRLH